MRKAGKFDDATVNEITYRVGNAVRKAGGLLEEIAPGQGARTDTTSRTSSGSYAATIKEANMGDDTALNWRAASKLGMELVTWWDESVRGKGERANVTDRGHFVEAATDLTGFTKQQVSKWRRRLKDRDQQAGSQAATPFLADYGLTK